MSTSPWHLSGTTGSRLVMNHQKINNAGTRTMCNSEENYALYHQMAPMTAEEDGILFGSCQIIININQKMQHT
jgi:hypothetical protein